MLQKELIKKAALINLVIFDVDGVLTNGCFYLGSDSSEYSAFYSRDGHGIKMLLEAGIKVAIVSGRRSASVERRITDLGIRYCYLGIANKIHALEQLQELLTLSLEQIAYVGDDLIDLPIMVRVGLSIAVQDADPFVLAHAHWQTVNRGGRGAARDVCELLLKAHGQLDTMRNRYLL